MNTPKVHFSEDDYTTRAHSLDPEKVAHGVYQATCRTDFNSPGFCVIKFDVPIESHAFRRFMVQLKRELSKIHESVSGHCLRYLSAARFDQQESTKFHLDGGPPECFLMLGYEPSEVEAVLEIADYSQCAFDLGLTPSDFMQQHNPMFKAGLEVLMPYVTRIASFKPSDFQIVCINNAYAALDDKRTTWQGTLHTATIVTPDESKRRVINSTMIASMPIDSGEDVDLIQQDEFVSTNLVRRRGYKTQHLNDDV